MENLLWEKSRCLAISIIYTFGPLSPILFHLPRQAASPASSPFSGRHLPRRPSLISFLLEPVDAAAAMPPPLLEPPSPTSSPPCLSHWCPGEKAEVAASRGARRRRPEAEVDRRAAASRSGGGPVAEGAAEGRSDGGGYWAAAWVGLERRRGRVLGAGGDGSRALGRGGERIIGRVL